MTSYSLFRRAVGASLAMVSGLLIGAEQSEAAASPRAPRDTPKVERDTWSNWYRGPVVKNGFAASDVRQGKVGDCGFASAVAACAAIDPGALARAIRDNGDGTVTVRLFEKEGRKFVPHEIKVDRKLETSSSGPIFGRSPVKGSATNNMEMWWPLLEKAYLEMIGGPGKLTFGQLPNTPLSALLGKDTKLVTTAMHSPDRLYQHLKASLDRGRPIVAATLIKPFFFRGEGLRPFHNHAVLSVFTDKHGEKFVQLRDPFGATAAKKSKGDGVFVLSIEKFAREFAAFGVVKETP